MRVHTGMSQNFNEGFAYIMKVNKKGNLSYFIGQIREQINAGLNRYCTLDYNTPPQGRINPRVAVWRE